jgi:hypothetical protein
MPARNLLPALVLAAGCSQPAEPSWEVVHEGLPGALLSIWGTSATDVWAVGGDVGDGPTVLHYDGTSWDAPAIESGGALWWVHGFEGGPVYTGGEGGRILRHAGGAFEEMDTPGTGIVFGIWGSGPDDLWAVGGNFGGASGAFVWRSDGGPWRLAEGFPTDLAGDHAAWKVWGSGPDDVYVVGTRGLLLHYDGAGFTPIDSGTERQLLTVHVRGDRAVAVGGAFTGVIVERGDEGVWRDVSPEVVPQMMGVWLTEEGGVAVGFDAQILRQTRNGWEPEQTGLDAFDPLHAVWVDPDGGIWAVGGEVFRTPQTHGIMIYRGSRSPAAATNGGSS